MRMKGFTLAARVMAKFLKDIKYFIAKLSVCMYDRSLKRTTNIVTVSYHLSVSAPY